MQNTIVILLFLLCEMQCSLQAQTKSGIPHRNCSSTFNAEKTRNTNPLMYERFIKFEKQIEEYKQSKKINTQDRLVNNNSIIIIPVVVHVVHNGESIGTGRNISVAQIESQIDVLNHDLRRTNADAGNTPNAFTGVAADARIEFRLTCVDPSGNSTSGITRTQSSVTSFTDDNAIKSSSTGGADPWPTDKYLNIWVSYLSGGLLGYASWPWNYSSSPNVDGIVVESTAFGTTGNATWPYDNGRTASHEIGHWLGLIHIWGDDGTSCSGTDYCADTPNQAGPSWGCPSFPTTDACSPSNPGIMFMNYMDYTVDGCKNLFTEDQVDRMRSCFISGGGARAGFIYEYFQIINPSPICTSTGTVSVYNPTCETVTWTIVSGPATIFSGQSTNTVTLSKTGNGVAVIRAEAGGYIDEREVTIGVPEISFITFDNPEDEYSYWCSSSYGNTFNVEPQVSGALYEARLLYWPSLNIAYTDPSTFSGTNSIFGHYTTPGWYVFETRGTNACGTGDWFGNEIEYVDCSLLKNANNLKEGFSIIASPNPAKDRLSVSIIRNNKTVSKGETIQLELLNLYTRTTTRKWQMTDNAPAIELNVKGLKGLYFLVVTIGKARQIKQIIIE